MTSSFQAFHEETRPRAHDTTRTRRRRRARRLMFRNPVSNLAPLFHIDPDDLAADLEQW